MTLSGLIAFSVLTLNIWGLPGVGPLGLAPKKAQRLQGICQELKKAAGQESGWDIVLLQEVWLKEDRSSLSRCGYHQAVDLNHDQLWLDSGLLLLSKHPVVSSQRLTYPALPLGSEVFEDGEALVRKSAVVSQIEHPTLGKIWVANTHLVSFYGEGEADQYREIRRNQFIQFIEWAQKKAAGAPLIVGGDWNFGAYDKDLWSEKERLIPDYMVSRESELFSTLSSDNTFQIKDQGRVDHIFASSHFHSLRGELGMHQRIQQNGEEFNLSDHFGWTEVFLLSPAYEP